MFHFNIRAPLHLAVEKGDINIINILLSQKSININVKDEIL